MLEKDKIKSPKISSNIEKSSWKDCIKKQEFSDKQIESEQVNDYLEHMDLNGMIFKNVDFRNAKWNHVSLIDTIFNHCDLSNVDLSDVAIHRVKFQNCKLMGTDFSASSIEDVEFDNCNANYSNFSYANCKYIVWKETQLEETSMNNVHFRFVFF